MVSLQKHKALIAKCALGTFSIALLAGVGCNSIPPTVTRISPEAAGSNCKYGGLKVESGGDANDNRILDNNEVDASKTSYTCAVLAEGKVSRVRLTNLLKGSTICPAGGVKIDSGLDRNENGKLDDTEIDSTTTVCSGEDGTDGTNGTNGYDSIVRLSDLPSGERCSFGGTLISSGLDKNYNGILDAPEALTTSVVCSVRVVDKVIVETRIVFPGQEGCIDGGVKMTAGVDANDDKSLQPGEISGSNVVCNKTQVIPGQSSLIKSSAATSAQCAWGGTVYQHGLDSNYNNVLDASEVKGTNLVCNGANGFTALVKQTAFATGTSQCGGRAGITYQSGLDKNYNNILDSSEVTETGVICNGETGPDGKPSLIKQTGDTVVCGKMGGVKIQSGVDDDRDNQLDDPAEVDFTSYVCNGFTPLIDPVPVSPGTLCSNGGVRYNVGSDDDGDGVLDTGEIDSSDLICHGEDGWIVDVSQPAESTVCSNGGVKVKVGPDLDGDTRVTGSEVRQTTYVCNGI